MEITATKKPDSIFNTLETVFKFLFLTLTMLSFNNLFAGHIALKGLALIVLLFGAVIVGHRLLTANRYLRFFGFPILLALVASNVVSCIVNYRYGILENIQGLAWTVFHFGILYATDTKQPKEKSDKIYFALIKYYAGYIAVSNLVSLGMLFADYGENAANSFSGNITGYIWGRLWGVYSDPNYGSVMNVAAVIISCYLLSKAQGKLKKIVFALNILLSLCYIAFSDSRTGMVCLAVVSVTYSYMLLKSKLSLKIHCLLKQLICLVLSAVICVASVASLSAIKLAYNEGVHLVHYLKTDVSDNTPTTPDSPVGEDTPKEPEQNKPLDTIGRTGNELESDITNGRLSLWLSGIEIWKTAPVFGTSHRNITPYAVENVPDTYMVDNKVSVLFDTTHNTYVDVLLAQGLVGAILVAVFLVLIVALIFKKMIFHKGNEFCTSENIMMLGILVTFACSAVFVLEVMYINTAGAFLFWLSLGTLVRNLKKET